MKRYLSHMIKAAERRTEHFLITQVNDPANPMYGGMEGDILDVKPTVYVLASAAAVYLNPESHYYLDADLMDAMHRAIDFVAKYQRENGSYDFLTCNFQSAPDTAFIFKALVQTYHLFVKYQDRADTSVLQKKYLAIMKRAVASIRDGGFHTPNHRWAICAALFQGANLFADDKEFAQSLVDRTVPYLKEGIDGNEDGEYAERSTGGYNGVVNGAMIEMYEETKNTEYLGYVERNLHMMQYYFDPDDTVFTQNSTRQDHGKKLFADLYFLHYLFMVCYAPLSDELRKEFDDAAHKIIKDNKDRGDFAFGMLEYVMNYDEMMNHTFSDQGFMGEYRKYFKDAGVLRVKKKAYGYTVMNQKSGFLYFNVEGMQMYMKIGESYCEIRNFIPQKMEVTEDGCVLETLGRSWYYLPWNDENRPDTKDWWQMDNVNKRERLIQDTLRTIVTIKELEDGLEIGLKTEGLKNLPLRLELGIPAGTLIRNNHFRMEASAGKNMILCNDTVELVDGERIITFGDGFCEHSFKGHYSGEEINSAGFTIYCNAYTPVEKKVTLRRKR